MLKMIKNWLLKNLLNAITLSDIIKYDKGQWSINGRGMTIEEMEAIKEEAKFISKTRIWALLQGTLAEEAKDRMFNKARTIDDIMWGKALLYNLDLQNQIISTLKNIK
jgi:hypothetical protein